jgi:hypothetical protein
MLSMRRVQARASINMMKGSNGVRGIASTNACRAPGQGARRNHVSLGAIRACDEASVGRR